MREPIPCLGDTGGVHSPEAGRHRESNPGTPDHRNGALPPAAPEPQISLAFIDVRGFPSLRKTTTEPRYIFGVSDLLRNVN